MWPLSSRLSLHILFLDIDSKMWRTQQIDRPKKNTCDKNICSGFCSVLVDLQTVNVWKKAPPMHENEQKPEKRSEKSMEQNSRYHKSKVTLFLKAIENMKALSLEPISNVRFWLSHTLCRCIVSSYFHLFSVHLFAISYIIFTWQRFTLCSFKFYATFQCWFRNNVAQSSVSLNHRLKPSQTWTV